MRVGIVCSPVCCGLFAGEIQFLTPWRIITSGVSLMERLLMCSSYLWLMFRIHATHGFVTYKTQPGTCWVAITHSTYIYISKLFCDFIRTLIVMLLEVLAGCRDFYVNMWHFHQKHLANYVKHLMTMMNVSKHKQVRVICYFKQLYHDSRIFLGKLHQKLCVYIVWF